MDRGDLGIVLLIAALFYVIAATSLVPWTAKQRGRSGFAWMLIALFFSPLLALLALNAVPELEEEDEPEAHETPEFKWRKEAD